jgi:hypothetical protein
MMDRPEFTEDEANAKLASALIDSRSNSNHRRRVLITGIENIDTLEQFNYTVRDVVRYATAETLRQGRAASQIDYDLKREECPLNQTFRTALTRFERSR